MKEFNKMEANNILETLNTWHNALQKSQHKTNLNILRDIINKCHEYEVRYFSKKKLISEDIKEALKIIDVLKSIDIVDSNGSIEEQTLRSTAYCVLLSFQNDEVKKAQLKIENDKFIKATSIYHTQYKNDDQSEFSSNVLRNRKEERKLATHTTGLYQSNLLKPSETDCEETKLIKREMIKNSFNLMAHKCLTYSCCTFLHFKNLSYILNKISEWNEDDIIDNDSQNFLLYVIFNNWENLVSGVREWNVKILNYFLKIVHKNKSSTSLNELIARVMELPWNKAKYLALSEIISYYHHDVTNIIHEYPEIVHGLHYSLIHSSLVSAGTDLYKVILNKSQSYADWCEMFLQLIETIFLSTSHYEKRNLLIYWIPVSVKKYSELVEKFIIILLQNQIENNYYSFISFVKYCRKNGYLLNDWKNGNDWEMRVKEIVDIGLVHLDEDVRAEAFHVICETNNKNIPCTDEIQKVKVFLENNVSNDSTPFRQNNLNSFTLFFIRLHDSYLSLLKKNKDDELNNIGNFFVWIFEFLHNNLSISGNYQRKIMSLQMYNIMFQYLCENSNDKNNKFKKFSRKGRKREQKYGIIEHWKIKHKNFFNTRQIIEILMQCLKDNTDDIRETAAEVLINYFINNEVFSPKMLEKMSEDSIDLCNSFKFYESASGCLINKILARISNKEEANIKQGLKYYCHESFCQFKHQKYDLLLSLYHNMPLHGVLSTLNIYIKACELELDDKYISSVVTLLEDISNYFINILALKSESGIFPPSFAEMGESVEEIIRKSTLEKYGDEEVKQPILSDAHQLILNNIWLNLKACCELSTTILIKSTDKIEVLRVLNICIAVLTKCRHKGAIEAAGVCLGSSIKHLTSAGNSEVNGAIITQLLETLLLELTSENIQGGSITRRSAGLTILVHRIVTNDSQDDKPLFHLTMKILLQALTKENIEDKTISSSSQEGSDIANERDIPLARALHLLCRTVCESSLSFYIIQYAHQLARVCFRHLVSQQWQVRNAALQLYGSLVPKIIGQKKNHGEETSEAPVSIDELFCHIPSLWNIVKIALKSACEEDTLVSHSNIIPILSLLSSTSRRHRVSIFTPDLFQLYSIPSIVVEELIPHLIKLVGSPIHAVRNGCAKIISIFYNINTFKMEVNKCDTIQGENLLHGFLLTLKYYVDFYKSNLWMLNEKHKQFNLCNLKDILIHLERVKIEKRHSYLVETILMYVKQVLTLENFNLSSCNFDIFEVVDNIELNTKAGFYLWYKTQLTYSILNCEQNELPKIVTTHFYDHDFIELDNLDVLKQRIIQDIPTEESTLKLLFEILLKISESQEKSNSKKAYEIMYILCNCNPKIVTPSTSEILMKKLDFYSFIQQSTHSLLLPLLCCISSYDNVNTQTILKLSELCLQFSKPDKFDAETRFICATSLKHLKFSCNKLSNDSYVIKKNIFSSVIWLLQDENSDVRKKCAEGNILFESDQVKCASNQLNEIFTTKIIWENFHNDSKQFLVDLLDALPSDKIDSKVGNDLVNPFNHHVSNIFWEPIRLKLKIEQIINDIKQ